MSTTPPPLPTSAATPLDGFRLSEEQLRAVSEAQARAKKIRRAIAVAKFDAWSVAIFGGATLLFGAMSWSVVGILLGAGMCIIAWVEFQGISRIRQLHVDATKTLGLNQFALGGLLILYALYSLWGVYHNASQLDEFMKTQGGANSLPIDVGSLEHLLGLLVYGTLIAVGLFGQGGTALYYFSRRKYIEGYLRDTPAWIVDAQRAGLPL